MECCVRQHPSLDHLIEKNDQSRADLRYWPWACWSLHGSQVFLLRMQNPIALKQFSRHFTNRARFHAFVNDLDRPIYGHVTFMNLGSPSGSGLDKSPRRQSALLIN
jgi:hypothetical protein